MSLFYRLIGWHCRLDYNRLVLQIRL
uniref:Uncharacterized protein n=1 Tax=Anguilla anguilla TaxID=7936 RepID=A0A0E9V9E0_ANGAN